MAFTINQVRHLYVAKTLKSGTNIEATDAAGSILPKADTAKSTLWFQYMSPAGVVCSDKIKIANIKSAISTASAKLAYKLKRYEITLDDAVSAEPIAGQEYVLRVAMRQYIGFSEEDQHQIYGMAKATTGMTASTLYKLIALSLAKNAYKNTFKAFNIYLNSTSADGTDVDVTDKTKEEDLEAVDYDKIILEEVEQEWILGKMPQAIVPFTPQFLTITVDGDEALWGKVTKAETTKTIENGKNIADLEYFCMGARGDMYRGMGYPNNIITTYVADPTQKYDTIDIHYYFEDGNEGPQKSERTITLVCKDDGSHTDVKALIAKINSVSGLTIANPA